MGRGWGFDTWFTPPDVWAGWGILPMLAGRVLVGRKGKRPWAVPDPSASPAGSRALAWASAQHLQPAAMGEIVSWLATLDHGVCDSSPGHSMSGRRAHPAGCRGSRQGGPARWPDFAPGARSPSDGRVLFDAAASGLTVSARPTSALVAYRWRPWAGIGPDTKRRCGEILTGLPPCSEHPEKCWNRVSFGSL